MAGREIERVRIGEDMCEGAEFGLGRLWLRHGSRQGGEFPHSLLCVAGSILHQELKRLLTILTCMMAWLFSQKNGSRRAYMSSMDTTPDLHFSLDALPTHNASYSTHTAS